jgi:hypothetical protein
MYLSATDLRKIADSLDELAKIQSITVSEIVINPKITVAVKKVANTDVYCVTQIRQVGA